MTKNALMRVDHIRIGRVGVAPVSATELLNLMLQDCASKTRRMLPHPMAVFDTNGQGISLYHSDPDYAADMEQADLIHADGQFIVWASRLKPGPSIPERTATTDFIHDAARVAALKGLGFYLLGSSEKINAACADVLTRTYPGLHIVGRRDGYFTAQEEPGIVADIAASGADILWVGLGKPKEQAFVIRNRDALGVAWAVTCGGCFHFVVGDYARAPIWMQTLGLEWLHRMATGPGYLLRRYLTTIPHVIWLVLRHDLFSRSKEPRND